MLLPGGDACAKQPWRSAFALLHTTFGSDFAQLPICCRLAEPEQIEFVRQMLDGGVSSVPSSSTGRLFDAMAALLGLCCENRFDAEAPMALEAAARSGSSPPATGDQFILTDSSGLIEIDLTPLVKNLVHAGTAAASVGDFAMLFHQTLAAAWAAAIKRAMHDTTLRTVALSGGCVLQRIVHGIADSAIGASWRTGAEASCASAERRSIAYGQAAVASARVKSGLNGK